MDLFLLLGAYFASSFGGCFGNKKVSTVLRGGTTDQPVYVLITAAVACLFFALLGGFRVSVNAITWLYAALFSVTVLAALLLTLAVYRFAKIPTVTVVKSTLSLIATAALGTWLFDERPDGVTGLRIVLLLVASLLLYASARHQERRAEKEEGDRPDRPAGLGRKIGFVLTMGLLIANTCAVTLLTKSYAIRDDVSDANSYYFATNLILLGMGLVWLLIAGRGKFRRVAEGLGELRLADYLYILLTTLSSNVNSLVSIPLAAMLDVAAYSACTSALGIVGAAVSSVCFREKQDAFSVSAIVIAAVSFLIGVI